MREALKPGESGLRALAVIFLPGESEPHALAGVIMPGESDLCALASGILRNLENLFPEITLSIYGAYFKKGDTFLALKWRYIQAQVCATF